MSKAVLLEALNETLQKCHNRRMACEAKVEESRREVGCQRMAGKQIEERREKAIFVDEELKRKMEALTAHVNSLAEKPAVLLREIHEFQMQQSVTYRNRERAEEEARQWQEAIQKKEQDLRFVEDKLRQAQEDYQQLLDEIHRIQKTA